MLKKGLSLIMVMTLVATLFVGCGKTEEAPASTGDDTTSSNTESTSKPKDNVVLKVYLGGDEKEGQDEVFAKANEMLSEKLPGVQMDIQLISYGEWLERWKLLTAAGDQMDVAWIGWMHNYDVLAREGQLLPLNDLIDEKIPEIKEALPEFVFDKATVDGQIYSIPNYQQMVEMRRGIRLYKNIADESVDVEALETKFTEDLTFDKDDWDVLEPYFVYAKENDLLQNGAGISLAWLAENGYETIGKQKAPVAVRIGDEKAEVVNFYTTSQYQDMIKTMADWYTKGYIRGDILSVENPREDEYQPGGNIAWVHETLKGQSEKDTKRLAGNGGSAELQVVPTADYQYIAPYGTPTNFGIPFTAKHPEEAIQLINLLNTDKEFYNLMVYGLEGVHYEKIDENTINVTDSSSYGLANWATGNTLLGYELEGGVSGWNEYLDTMHREAITSNLMGFKVNTEPVMTELQQIATVVKEYQATLEYGAMGAEYEKTYNDFLAKLEKAGISKVVDEYQQQIDAFLAQ